MGKKDVVLTERDIKIFDLIKKFGWLREDYIAQFLGFDWSLLKTKNNINSLAHRLSKSLFIEKKKIIEGYPAYWRLGKIGAEFMNATEEKKFVLMTLRHNDFVADLAIKLLIDGKNVKTEYELKQDLYGEAAKKTKLPDLVIDDNLAIEIELSRKNDTKLAVIVNKYLMGNYKSIIYYTDSKVIANKVYQLSKNSSLFKFMLFDGVNIKGAVEYTPVNVEKFNASRDEAGKFQSMNGIDALNKLMDNK
jgi:hypothetical protein